MKKAMISQPMTDKTPEEIKTVKELAVRNLQLKGFEVVNSYFEDDWANPEAMISRGVRNIPMAFIARSIEVMATCDAMYFCKDWEKSRGCKIEHEVAVAYGMEIIYE